MKKSAFNFLVVSGFSLTLILLGAFLYNKFFKHAHIEEAYIPPAEIGRISPPELIPNFSFLDETGLKKEIKNYTGKILIINFWATWCAPCVKELPQFDQMVEIFGDENMEIIPISIDSAVPAEKLRTFYDTNEIKNLKIYQDKTLEAYESIMSFGVPTTILVDRDLKAHLKVSGYLNWSDPQIMNMINALP